MRLVKVEDFIAYLGNVHDTPAIRQKLAGYLNEATIHIETYLNTRLTLGSAVDKFVPRQGDYRARPPHSRYLLSRGFVRTSPAPKFGVTSSPVFSGPFTELDPVYLSLNSDQGKYDVFERDLRGRYVLAQYDYGFAVVADPTYNDFEVDEPIPDALANAAMAVAANVRDNASTMENCGDGDDCACDGPISSLVVRLLEPYTRLGVDSVRAL